MRRHYSFLLAAFLAAASPTFGQQAAGTKAAPEEARAVLARGIDLFGQERYRDALDAFGRVLSDPSAGESRSEAAYWSVLAYIAAGDRETAFASIEAFVSAYPTSHRLPDILYQRGRLLYAKGEHESALKAFAAFAEAAPKSDLIPSALYWSGECLYSLGHLEEAERAFATVVEKYPASVKVEAASYRRSLIGLEYRERELLKLLTWSHEESLRSVEDFRRREKAYEQSIAIYQKQLGDTKRGAVNDQERAIADLRAQAADLGSRLAAIQAEQASLRAENDGLKAEVAAEREKAEKAAEEAKRALAAALAVPAPATAQAPAPAPAEPPVPAAELPAQTRMKALEAKARALDLLAFYLEKISKEGKR